MTDAMFLLGPLNWTDAARHLDSSISHSYLQAFSLAFGHGGFLASVWDFQERAPIGPSRSADCDQPGGSCFWEKGCKGLSQSHYKMVSPFYRGGN